MAKAIIWCRVSTVEQELETQKNDLIAWATSKEEGHSMGDLIILGEKGASAIKMNDLYLNEVNQLVNTIETNSEVKTVYVWEVSRLARNDEAFLKMKKTIVNNKVQFRCRVPQIKLLDDDGSINHASELMLSLLLTLAKQEMEIKVKRFARGKKRLAEQGRYNGGAVPFGYRVSKEQGNLIVIDEEESSIIREIYDMYERGYSQMAIAKVLYFRGVKGRAVKKTKNFTISLVHQILTNRLLTGEPHLSKGASYTRTYPPIISIEQFNRCREIASKNNTNLPKAKVPYYGAKIIKCIECGRNFVSTGNSGYYHCQDAHNINKTFNGYPGVPRCSNRVTISYNVMDALLWRMAQVYEIRYIADKAREDVEAYKSNIKSLRKELEAVPMLLKALEEETLRVGELYQDGVYSKEKYSNERHSISMRTAEIKRNEAVVLERLRHNEYLLSESSKKDSYLSLAFNSPSRLDEIEQELASISDDDTRRAMIRKHIKLVTVESATIKQKYGSQDLPKDVLAKKITIETYSNVSRTFYYVPFDGKGGHMLEVLPRHSPSDVSSFHEKEVKLHPYKLDFFQNRYAKHKYRKREEIKKSKQEVKDNKHADMIERGFISMDEMRSISKLSYSTIYKAIKDGILSGAENVLHKWYVPRDVFVRYLHDKSPKARVKKAEKRGI